LLKKIVAKFRELCSAQMLLGVLESYTEYVYKYWNAQRK